MRPKLLMGGSARKTSRHLHALGRGRESGLFEEFVITRSRSSRNHMTARVNDDARNFGASYNFRVHQALGNLRTLEDSER